jgi:hypothetical protein
VIRRVAIALGAYALLGAFLIWLYIVPIVRRLRG